MSFWDSLNPFSWLASLFGSAINAGSQIYTNSQNISANKDINKQNIAFQQQTNQENRDFTREMFALSQGAALDQWHRENAYNDPSAQRQRFEAAGLNPNLVYGSGLSSLAANFNPASSSQGNAVSPHSDPYYRDAPEFDVGNMLSIERQRAEIDAIRANTKKTENESSILATEASFKSALLSGELDLQGATIKLTESQANYTDVDVKRLYVETKKLQREIDMLDEQLPLIRAQVANMDADTLGKKISNYFASDTFKANLAKLHSETGLNSSQIKEINFLMVSKKLNLDSDTEKKVAETLHIDVERANSLAINQGLNIQNGLLSFEASKYIGNRSSHDLIRWNEWVNTIGNTLTLGVANALGGAATVATKSLLR